MIRSIVSPYRQSPEYADRYPGIYSEQYDSKSLNLYDTVSLPQRIFGYPQEKACKDFFLQIRIVPILCFFVSINLLFFDSAAK